MVTLICLRSRPNAVLKVLKGFCTQGRHGLEGGGMKETVAMRRKRVMDCLRKERQRTKVTSSMSILVLYLLVPS